MSNTNNNLQTQTSSALHNAIMEASGKDCPPMLAPGNYVQWKSRIKRYIDTKPNHELIHFCLKNPPYQYKFKSNYADTTPATPGNDGTPQQQPLGEIILTGIDNDIYSTVDACPNEMKMWKAIDVTIRVPLQAEQADWLEETDEEIDEQELEAHYSYMAKIQEVSPAESSLLCIELTLPLHKTRTPQLPHASRNTNPHMSKSSGVIHSTSISRPQLKCYQVKEKVMPNISQVKFTKKEVEDHHRIFSISKKTKSVTACNDSSNSRTSNVNAVCAECGKCVEKFLGTVRFGNDQFAPILGYGDLIQGNVTIKRVYYVEGLNHNLFSVGQFCDADLEVAFRKSTCFVRDLQGNDLL
ncbi:hypothetical protein Tco_0343625 [Tanacetum coccineum]